MGTHMLEGAWFFGQGEPICPKGIYNLAGGFRCAPKGLGYLALGFRFNPKGFTQYTIGNRYARRVFIIWPGVSDVPRRGLVT